MVNKPDIHLRLFHTLILDRCKVFETLLLVCCLKGIWIHPYAITLAKLAQDLGIQGHLWSENDVIISSVWLKSILDHIIHPY